jgi:hypothetical protein
MVSVPTALIGSTATSLAQQLQTYLNGVSGSLMGGTMGLVNWDIAAGTEASVNAGSAGGTFMELTNYSSTGASTAGTFNGTYSIPGAVTDLVVDAPGSQVVYSTGSVTSAMFGGASNVNYNVFDGQGSVYLLGGADSVNATSTTPGSMSFYSAGQDSINLSGIGSPTINGYSVYAEGNATTAVYIGGSDVATVVASDNAHAAVVFYLGGGGNLDFINASTQEQTIFSGAHTIAGSAQPVLSNNAITAFGGAGGGFFVGGANGYNSLVGGFDTAAGYANTGNAGLVTLVGGGAHDMLLANGADSTGSGGYNAFFSGNGSFETLMASGSTNDNLFSVGLTDVGVGVVTAFGDVVSSAGAGTQNYFVGNSENTNFYADTTTGSTNNFWVIGDTITGGPNGPSQNNFFTINDFGANSAIVLVNATLGTSDASIQDASTTHGAGGSVNTVITLTDNTQITLKGVSTSNLSYQIGGNIVTYS